MVGSESTSVTFEFSAREHRFEQGLEPYNQFYERLPLVPWKEILAGTVGSSRQNSNLQLNEKIVSSASFSSTMKVDEALPPEVLDSIKVSQGNSKNCPQCHNVLLSSDIASELSKLSSKNGTFLAVALDCELLKKRDALDWNIAKDFYSISRVVEDDVVRSIDTATHPHYLILETFSRWKDVSISDVALKLDQLSSLHGSVTLLLMLAEASERKVVATETIYSSRYCSFCNEFIAKTTHSNLKLRSILKTDLLKILTEIQSEFVSVKAKAWVSFLLSKDISHIFEHDEDFFRFLASLKTALEDLSEKKTIKIELTSSLVKIIPSLKTFGLAVGITIEFHTPHASISIQNTELQKTTTLPEYIVSGESVASECLFDFLSLGGMIAKRFASTLQARTSAITQAELLQSLKNASFNKKLEEVTLEYLGVTLDEVAVMTIDQLVKKWYDDSELSEQLQLLSKIGLGSCFIDARISSLIKSEKQRLWLIDRLISARKRRKQLIFVVEDIESDLGNKGAENLFELVTELAAKKHLVYRSYYEADEKLFIQYA